MSLGGFTAAAAKVVLGVDAEQFNAGIRSAEAQFAQAAAAMGGTAAELAERQVRASVAADRYTRALAKYGPATTEAKAAIGNLIREQRQLIDLQNASAASAGRFERGMVAAGSRGMGFGRAMTFASNAFIGGAGFVYAVHSAINASTKFQGEMALLQTQALKTHGEVQRMTKAVLAMAPALATSPDALAKGLYRIESAGYQGAHALEMLKIATQGARVGHSDLEQTTNSLIAAQKSGIKGAENLSFAMGTLDAIVGAGNMRMEDLTKSLASGVIASARGAGVSLAQLGGALATMTTNGATPAELAATRLRYSIALLAAQTPKAEKELRSIGLTSTELGETMKKRGLLPAIELLSTKLKTAGLDSVQQQRILTRAFGGGRSYSTILTLVQNVEALREKTKLIEASGQHFGERWKAQTKTAEFAFARLSSIADVVKIKLGNALLPSAIDAARGVSHWLESAENQRRLQRDVIQGFHDAKEAAHVFGAGLHQLGEVLHFTDGALGGTGHTLKLLAELLVMRKALGFAKQINSGVLDPLRAMTKAAGTAVVAIQDLDAATVRSAVVRGGSGEQIWGRNGELLKTAPWRLSDEQRAAEAEATARLEDQKIAAVVKSAQVIDTTRQKSATVAERAKQRTVAAAKQESSAVVKAANEEVAAIEQVTAAREKSAAAAEATSLKNLDGSLKQGSGRSLDHVRRLARSGALGLNAGWNVSEAMPTSFKGVPANDPMLLQAAARHVMLSGSGSATSLQEGLGLSYAQAGGVMKELARRKIVERGDGVWNATAVHPMYGNAERILADTGYAHPVDLARRLNVSTREANQILAQLAHRGVIEQNPNFGNGQMIPGARPYNPRDVQDEIFRRQPGLITKWGNLAGGSKVDEYVRMITDRMNANYAAEHPRLEPPFRVLSGRFMELPDDPYARMADRDARFTASAISGRRTPRNAKGATNNSFTKRVATTRPTAAANAAAAAHAAAEADAQAAAQAELYAKAQMAVVESGNVLEKTLRDRLGVSREVAKALQQELRDTGFVAQAMEGAAMAADVEAKAAENLARVQKYGSQEAADYALAIEKLELLQKRVKETYASYVVPGSYQEALKEGRAAGMKSDLRIFQELMNAEQRAAYSADKLGASYDRTTGKLNKQTDAIDRADSAMRKLTADEERELRLRERMSEINGVPHVTLNDGSTMRYRSGFYSGGEQLFLQEKEMARLGLIPRVGGKLKSLGSAINGRQDAAMGVGMMAMLFGDQVTRLPGGHGFGSMVTGAGSGAMFGPMLGVNPWVAAGVGASFGLKHAIGGRKGSGRAQAGSILGAMGEGAALGALAGTMGGPLAPLSVPVGAAAGAAVGLAASLFAMSRHANATTSSLDKLAAAANKAAGAGARAKQAIEIGQVQIANDRVARDQAKSGLAEAHAQEKAARGTKDHGVALDNLRAAQANYHASVMQVRADLRNLAKQHQIVRDSATSLKQAQAAMSQQLLDVGASANQQRQKMVGLRAITTTSADRVQVYVDKMNKLSASMKASHPKLALAAAELARIAANTNKIPSKKVVDVVVKFGYDPASLKNAEAQWAAFLGAVGPMAQAMDPLTRLTTPSNQATFRDGKWYGANGKPLANQQAAWDAFGKKGPVRAKNGDTVTVPAAAHRRRRGGSGGDGESYNPEIPQGMTTAYDLAVRDNNVGQQRHWLHKMYAYLNHELTLAHTSAQRDDVYRKQAQINASLASLDSKSISNGGVGLIPQRLQDAVAQAIQAHNKPAQLKALGAERSWLQHFLQSHHTGLAHHKAEALLTQVVRQLDRLNKSVAGSFATLIPHRLQMRVQDALQNLYSHGGNLDELKRERKDVLHYLHEKGHSKKDRAAAHKELMALDKRIKLAGKKGSGYGPVIAALQAEADWLTSYAHKKSTSWEQRIKAEQKVTQIDKQIASFRKKMYGTGGGAAGLDLTGAQSDRWMTLQIGYLKAQRTTLDKRDDIRALTAEQRFLKHYLEGVHTKKEQLAANKLLTSIDIKMAKLVKQQGDQLKALERQFLQEQKNFYATYGSNDFTDGNFRVPGSGNTINLNQTFHKPTDDHHREARLAKHAILAAFD